ncbi:hypothetical protein MXB_2482 [Myxobolus squamalis]|nr:hypothetical protein MXB_2482 [Myxobolus squamalis]
MIEMIFYYLTEIYFARTVIDLFIVFKNLIPIFLEILLILNESIDKLATCNFFYFKKVGLDNLQIVQ